MLVKSTSRDADNTDDELHDNHTRSSNNENFASAEPLYRPKRYWRGTNVHECRNQRDEERIADSAETLKEDGSKVEDKVDTGQLLHHLHEDT